MLSLFNLRRPLTWVYRTRFQLLMIATTAILTVCLLEISVRAFDLLGVSYYEESKRYHLDKIADPGLIYAHRRNWSGEYQFVDVSFNELGFRDDPIAGLESDDLRILLLGDSVAFGWGVDQDEIFAARLESIMSASLGRRLDVINTGVGSYNTVQQLATLERYGEDLAPDLLILLYVYNDIQQHERPFDPHAQFELPGKSFRQKLKIALGHSRLYRVIKHVSANRAPSNVNTAMTLSRPPGWIASIQALRKISDWASRRAVPFVLYGWRDSDMLVDPLWSALLDAGREGGFPVVEASPAWITREKYRLSVVDSHPNAAGHQRIADEMARDLLSRDLLPQLEQVPARHSPGSSHETH